MEKTVLIDTGPLVAVLRERDQHHKWARHHFASLRNACVTCEAVLSEAFHMLETAPSGAERLCALLEEGTIRINFDVDDHLPDVLRVLRRYRNLPMGFADACLVRMSELHRECAVFTTDSDFRTYRRHGRQIVGRGQSLPGGGLGPDDNRLSRADGRGCAAPTELKHGGAPFSRSPPL